MRGTTVGLRDLLRVQGVLCGLILLMGWIFVAQMLGPEGWYDPLMAVPKDVVAAWQRLLSGGMTTADWGAFASLFTCSLLHGDIEHLLGNMMFYWIFGALMCELLGWRWLLAMIFITAIGASIVHVGLSPDDAVPMLGASGVVSGLMGAYVAMSMRWRLPDPHIWPMARPVPPVRLALLAVVFIALDYRDLLTGVSAGIAFGAHVGGFTSGVFAAGMLAPRPVTARVRP